MRVIAAAVMVDGKVYRGTRHGECIKIAVLNGAKRVNQDQQGFLTDSGEYVNREDAARLAFQCGQIATPKRKLYSEDVW